MMSFAADVAPLFRPKDVMAMRRRFDLSDHADVTAHAAAVLETVSSGSMPCDTVWPEDRVAVLAAWIAAGCPA